MTPNSGAAPPFKALRLGLVQMVSGKDLAANLAVAEARVLACAEAGAQMVVLPEMFAIFGGGDQGAAGRGEASEAGPLRQFLAQLAGRAGVYLVGGSIPCQGANPISGAPALDRRVYASCFVYNPGGEEVGRYDKVHLFDADVDDAQGRYRESDTFAPGLAPAYFDSPWGRVGLAICYDLRFPEYFRQLADAGCQLVLVPAAFTYQTGRAHWQLLLRARALENQCYVAAAAQGGQHSARRQTWGHSAGVDPWGEVMAELGQGEGQLLLDLSPQYLADCRRRLPALQHRRL